MKNVKVILVILVIAPHVLKCATCNTPTVVMLVFNHVILLCG